MSLFTNMDKSKWGEMSTIFSPKNLVLKVASGKIMVKHLSCCYKKNELNFTTLSIMKTLELYKYFLQLLLWISQHAKFTIFKRRDKT